MAEDKKEITYQYPSVNPYEGRGNENVGFIEYRFAGKDFLDEPCKLFVPLATFTPEMTIAEFMEEYQSIWGANAKFSTIVTNDARKIANAIDDPFKTILKGMSEAGDSQQTMVDKLQAEVDSHEVNVPRAPATGTVKAKAAKLGKLEEKAQETEGLAGKSMEEIIAMAAKAAEAGIE